jgi:CheY-like chemotaxis protein/cell division protein FtsN
MPEQQIEGQRAQTILVVDSDEATRRILDLSLRHAGFAVRVASNAEEGDKRLADHPDLVIVAADDPEGLDFCRRAKQADALAPAVVLMLDPGVESKRRGLEAGADDFVARPIYVQEVVARSRALLQRRDRERLEHSAQENERFVSTVEDLPLVDLLRAIAANQKSGVALVMGNGGARGEIYFRQGRVVDAEVGRLSGRDAVYRLFCWPTGRLAVEWKSIRRKDTIETAPHDLLMEALRRVDEWRRLLAGVPSLDTIFEVDYRLLAERLADIPDEVNRILRLFDGMRTFLQVIDDCGLPDLDAVAAIGKLYRERIVHDIRASSEDEEAAGADMEGWLSDAAGPFRSPARQERDLFGAGPDAAAGVHGRRTAPIDPLGDGSREALDDDMRLRFTDRLAAEGAAPAEPLNDPPSDGIPEIPLEALVDSAPAAGNGTKPTTLPGVGASKGTQPGMGTSKTTEPGMAAADPIEVSRPAIPIATADIESIEDASRPITLQGRTSTQAASSVPIPPPTGAPVERPYGWPNDSGPGQPRSVSGEIHVQKLLAPLRPSQSQPFPPDTPRVQVREDSGKAYVRKSTATPAGSARALDEPPPITHPPADAGRKSDASAKSVAREPSKPAPSRTIHVDDGRDDKFSKSYAEGELGVTSRGRKVLVVAGVTVAVIVGSLFAIRVNTRKTPLADSAQSESAVPAPAPEQPTPRVAPTIAPIPAATAVATPVVVAKPAAPEAMMAAGHKAAPAAAAQPELDERAADPRMARERASEARPLLSVCRMAFEEKRMKDAEAACLAARDANPDSADAHALLAHALFNRNKRREALASAERAVKLNPKVADAYVIIGGVRQEQGDVDEARRAYQHYLDLEPKGSYAADLRAIIGRLPAKL